MHMRYIGILIKKNQFLFSIFIGIRNLIVISIGILEKTKT